MTRLARELAAAYKAELHEHTANPEWSVYDVIGSLALGSTGGVTPRHGLVTQAIIECCKTTSASLNGSSDCQAVWVLIDEVNRAEIDRAFGPLFTALADPLRGRMTLDYLPDPQTISIPRRFRIIATLNSFDTRFVNSMSAALRRRFARIAVLPPANDSDGAIPTRELQVAMDQARQSLTTVYSSGAVTAAAESLELFEERLRRFLGALRDSGDKGGIPFGTAQVLDGCAFTLSLLLTVGDPGTEVGRLDIIDRGLAARLTTSLESDSTRTRITPSFLPSVKDQFGDFPRTLGRLEAFLEGRD